MVAPFEFARTWLLERMYTRPSASRTRAPMVPAVIAGCPTENPDGAGRWRWVGSLKAMSRPVTRWLTGTPSSATGRPCIPERSSRICMPGRPSGSARGLELRDVARLLGGRSSKAGAPHPDHAQHRLLAKPALVLGDDRQDRRIHRFPAKQHALTKTHV